MVGLGLASLSCKAGYRLVAGRGASWGYYHHGVPHSLMYRPRQVGFRNTMIQEQRGADSIDAA